MGMWGIKPTENDRGTDWVESTFSTTGLALHVTESLNHSVDDHVDEVRVAAYLVRQLSDADLWPHESKRTIRLLAKQRLMDIVNSGIYTNPAILQDIRSEIVKLDRQPGLER